MYKIYLQQYLTPDKISPTKKPIRGYLFRQSHKVTHQARDVDHKANMVHQAIHKNEMSSYIQTLLPHATHDFHHYLDLQDQSVEIAHNNFYHTNHYTIQQHYHSYHKYLTH